MAFLKPIDRNATHFARQLASKIRKRGWAGMVGIIGLDVANDTYAGTGAGTGIWFQMDVVAAAQMLAEGLERARDALPSTEYDGLMVLVREKLGDALSEGPPTDA